MEENLQTIKGDSGNQEPPLKKVINDIDGKEGKTIIRNKNLQDPNNEIVEEENLKKVNKYINNEKANEEISNKLNNVKDKEKVNEETLNKVNKDKNNEKGHEEISNKLNNVKDKEKINEETLNKLTKDINNEKVNEDNSNKVSKDINNEKVGEKTSSTLKVKPKKELPIEKKPFNEFINDHLLPSIIQEFKVRGFEVEEINLKNTSRPIAGDKCWVIYCEIKEICNFWLSFEKEDISSLKSISLCKTNQKPSVIESFLIDEKRITLKLIISRILQRLNGQKLIGIN